MNQEEIKNSKQLGYNFGIHSACAINGITANDALRKSACVDTSLESLTMQVGICKLAKDILSLAGMQGTAEHKLYETLESSIQAPLTKYAAERFLVPVLTAINDYSKAMKEDAIEKSASFIIPSLIASGAGKVTASMPQALNLALIGSVGGGAALGSLGWMLNRDSNQTDSDIDAKELQAAHYRRIAKDISKRLKLQESAKKDNGKKKLDDAVKSQGEGAYMI